MYSKSLKTLDISLTQSESNLQSALNFEQNQSKQSGLFSGFFDFFTKLSALENLSISNKSSGEPDSSS